MAATSPVWGSLTSANPEVPSLDLSGDGVTVGRSSACSVVVSDLLVSGRHCAVTRDDDGRAMLVDTSTNGTFHNNAKVGKGRSVALADGDVVTVVPAQTNHVPIEFVFAPRSLAAVAGVAAVRAFGSALGGDVWEELGCVAGACGRAEAEAVATALVTAAEGEGCALDTAGVLSWAIEHEVAATERVSELFRGLSVETKLVSDYAKRVGAAYLVDTLQPTVLQLLSQGLSLEVDGSKLAKGESAEANLPILILYCNIVVQVIFESLDSVPPAFPHLFALMKAAVLAKWPEEEHIAVGGFVFLRFFCPALVSPHLYSIVTAPLGPREHRSLMLIAKTLQNMANGKQFGKKEPYMIPVNPFVEENMPRAQAFFNAISTPPPDAAFPPSLAPSSDDVARALLVLARAVAAAADAGKLDANAALLAPARDLLAAHAATPVVDETPALASVEVSAHAVKQSAMAELLRVTKPAAGAVAAQMSVPPPVPSAAAIRARHHSKSDRRRTPAPLPPPHADAAVAAMPVEYVVPAVDLNIKPVDFESLRALLPEDEALALIDKQYHYLLEQTAQLHDQLRRVGKEKRRWHHEALRLRRDQGLVAQPLPMDAQTVFDDGSAPFQLFLL